MFDLELSNYNKILENWNESNVKKLQTIKNTSNPNEFRFLFKDLLFEVINFDRLWSELNSFISLNLSGYLKTANSLKLSPPEKFIVKKNDVQINIEKGLEINELRKEELGKRKQVRKSYPNYHINEEKKEVMNNYVEIFGAFFSEANKSFEMFKEICRYLENSVEKYKEILEKFFSHLIYDLENAITEIEKKLNSVPPPEINSLYSSIQAYSELLQIWDANKKVGLLTDVVNQFNQMPNMINQGIFLNNYILNFSDKSILYGGNISSFQEINEKFREMSERRKEFQEKVINFGIITANAPKILKVLEQMNPEFPVFLPRLAELVELEKQPTEDALSYVLAKTPDLGKYDSMAQVLMFSTPNEVGKLIDSLLKEYENSNIKI